MTRSHRDFPAIAEKFARALSARRRPSSPRTQRILLVCAAVVFVVGGWYALRSLDVSWNDIYWPPLIVAALIGVPLTLLGNTFEYLVTARVLHHRVAAMPALRLTVLSTAANLLPLPGGILVRVQGLRSLGSGLGGAFGATAAVGLAWVGVSAVLAGLLLLPAGIWVPAAVLCGAGIPLLFLAYLWVGRSVTSPPERRRVAAMILAVELFAVTMDAARLILILQGLGIEASIGQTLVLAVSSSLAAAAGIMPGGFGIRELIAAVLAPLVGMAASAGFAVTAINRVMGILVMAPLTAALALGPQRGVAPPADELVPDEEPRADQASG